MTKNNPKVTVVMSSYNRKDYIKEAIESILNQTYQNFEFIIIDDCSQKETQDVIEQYAKNDERIIFLKNEHNMGQALTRNRGLEIARGEYIAILDDDDISLPTRLEKQVEYMDKNPDIMLSGTDIETFGGNQIPTSWVDLFDPEIISVLINFYNPFCASALIYRNNFIKKHNIKYDNSICHVEDYDLYRQILACGGKISNLPEVLVKYRIHPKSVTQNPKSQKLQISRTDKVRVRYLERFLDTKSAKKLVKKIKFYPFYKANRKKDIYEACDILRKNNINNVLTDNAIKKTIDYICGENTVMDIFFASNDNYVQHLSVAIASILVNSLPNEKFNFYILDGNISNKNKDILLSLKNLKDFNMEFIKVDEDMFKMCPITPECYHISNQCYYRYIIPWVKPELKKVLYLDCDIVVKDSLQDLWNVDLKDNYVAAVEDLCLITNEDANRLETKHYFNSGVMLINNELWKRDNIIETLFKNTEEIHDKIRWVDQCVLNYTFKDKVLFVSPKFNVQHSAFGDTKYNMYTKEEIDFAIIFPVIIHYTGCEKPWHKKCCHKLWKDYFKFLKYTPYKKIYYTHKFKKFMKSFLVSLFSLRNEKDTKILKCIGIKVKFPRKKGDLVNAK